MRFSKFRLFVRGLTYAAAAAGLLSGCSNSSVPASTGGTSSSGGTTQQTVKGIATPSSVSVVTAN
jgi:hypothetical protein